MTDIIIPYKDVNFLWISSHWDIHLKGLCKHDGKLCAFDTINPEDYDNNLVKIIPLSFIEKVKWTIRRKKFEWCVGYHWTYPYRNQDLRYQLRSPKWLWMIITAVYYKNLKLYKNIRYHK